MSDKNKLVCPYCKEPSDHLDYVSVPDEYRKLVSKWACEKCKYLIEWCDLELDDYVGNYVPESQIREETNRIT